MSCKPPKKSDLKKDWMKKRRDKKLKMQPEYHLIVSEGKTTEPCYFEEIKKVINQRYPGHIQLDIQGTGENTLTLLDRAKAYVRNSPNVYKHVWIIYDTDSFPAEHINKTEALCDQSTGDETEYHAIWSNQCIEVWFLLHFCFLQVDIDRKDYLPRLSEYLREIGKGRYSKNRQDMYTVLRPFLDTAIVNAEKLEKRNTKKTPASAAPGTKMHVLLKKLKPYL